MTDTLTQFLIGFIYGTAVSVFNYFITGWALKRAEKKKTERAKVSVMGVYALRLLINLAVLFSVYKYVPVLIGAAIGLTVVKNILLVKYVIFQRKG